MYPWLYYLVSISLLIILFIQSRPDRVQKRQTDFLASDTFFVGLSLVLLTFMRIPTVFYNCELNVDESQLLTQAMTLVRDPVYGRSVDGTSIGPINSYLLLIPYALGLPFDYISARITGLLLIAISLVFFYRSLRILTSPQISRLSFLPVLLFFGWATHPDFLHYSSELSSLVILTICFWLIVRLFQSGHTSLVTLAVVGIVAGLTPYAKLQTLPIVGMMLIVLFFYLLRSRSAVPSLLVLSVSFIVPTLVVFGLAYAFGVERYFIDYYFVGNLTTYSQIYAHVPLVSQGILPKMLRFPAFLVHHTDFLLFIGLSCSVIVGSALWVGRSWRMGTHSLSWPARLIIPTALGALWAVITPGTEFGHHLLLLVYPLSWATGLGLDFLRRELNYPALAGKFVQFMVVLCLVELVLADNLFIPYSIRLVKGLGANAVVSERVQPLQTTHAWLLTRNKCLFSFPNKINLPLSPVSRIIRHYTSPSDQLAVWGWNCRYYVETGLTQGVSENHTQRSIIPNAMQDQYLQRYAHELLARRPALFVDAVGPASLILNNPIQQHEYFPIINRIVQQSYSFLTTIDSVRIYTRRDRHAAMTFGFPVRRNDRKFR